MLTFLINSWWMPDYSGRLFVSSRAGLRVRDDILLTKNGTITVIEFIYFIC